ncbi:MAG: hypothetical protein IT535_01285 [Bauldia sp.]|nr:hypothetical protein [Bauldia sp.]
MAEPPISANALAALRGQYRDVVRESGEHRAIGLQAAKDASALLMLFEAEHPDDARPREALAALRAWASGERRLSMAEVRRLSLGSHAAARGARTEAAKQAARAIGHAVAVWHVPSHAAGVPYYGEKARKALRAASGKTRWVPASAGMSGLGVAQPIFR